LKLAPIAERPLSVDIYCELLVRKQSFEGWLRMSASSGANDRSRRTGARLLGTRKLGGWSTPERPRWKRLFDVPGRNGRETLLESDS